MRSLLVIALCLTGCSASRSPLPEQPNAPTSEAAVKQVGQDIETRSNKVAAAVTVVKENADKPHVVQAEAGVALSFLPVPSEGELAIARARSASTDPKAYESAAEQGKKLLAKINADLAKALTDQKEAARVSQLKDARIKELTAEVERVKQEASKNIWTLTGAGLAVIGALAFAFGGGPRVGLPLLLCGAFCGSVPFIVDSPYFLWVAVGTAAIAAGLGLWWLWDKVHDAVQDKKDEENLFKDDHHDETPKQG